MREIKFRAWDNLNKDMIFLDYIWNNHWYNNKNQAVLDNSNSVIRPKVQNGQVVIMQYTGLKDRNGKEIYEGDILHWNNDYIEIVEWSDKWTPHWKGLPDTRITGGGRACEIIGNIYENPELIK